MKPKTLFPLVVLLIGSALGLAAADRAPNLIVILCDDLGYGDIGPFGGTKARTPHLDRMAHEGARLTHFYAAAVCTPSRAQFMTGSYAVRVSLPRVVFPAAPDGISAGEHTLPELLRAQGYATAAFGKWHLGDQPEFLPTRHGFDHYFGIPYSNDMGPMPARPLSPPLPLLRDERVQEIVADQTQRDLTERFTVEALDFIRTNRARPFFLYFAHFAPHTPIEPGARFRGKSPHGLYTDWVEEIDDGTGRILAELRALGLAENTLVVFTSDNGPWGEKGKDGGSAAPLRGTKGGIWEGGVRVPTIAWWPGRISAGRTISAPASNLDFLPTLVGLAGGKPAPERKIDGRDLAPLLFGHTETSPHESLLYIRGTQVQAVRRGPWKLFVQRAPLAMGALTAEQARQPFTPQLFNLEIDSAESTDVAASHPQIVAELQAIAAAAKAEFGAEGKGPGVRPPGLVSDPKPLRLE